MKRFFQLFLLIVFYLFTQNNMLFANPFRDGHVEASMTAKVKAIQPGKPFDVLLTLKMDKGWHTYYKEPGEAGLPIMIDWFLPKGYEVEEGEWPKPKKFDDIGAETYGYEDKVTLKVKVIPPYDINPDEIQVLNARVCWVVCQEITIPGQVNFAIELPVKQ